MRLSRKSHRFWGTVSLLLGTALLAVAALGEWTPWGRGYGLQKREWERFDPALVTQVQDYTSLNHAVDERLAGQTLSDAEKMQVMYDIIADRFTHAEATHTLASNWILYLAGFVHPTFRHVWSPERFVSHGYSLFCDQASYLLLHLAHAHGFKTRHIGLQGHVIMEAWYDNDWHLYDPDLEVIPTNAQGRVLSLDELAQDESLLSLYYGPHTDMVALIRRRENHLYMSTPEEARFEWKGNVLAKLETVTEVLKFAIPLLLILLGLRLRRVTDTLPSASLTTAPEAAAV